MKQPRAGTVALLLADLELVELVGRDDAGEVKIAVGWPWEMLESDDKERNLPLVTVLRVHKVTRRRGLGHMILQVDTWVWPVGDNGGLTRLEAIDERVEDVLDEASWSHDGVQLYATTDDATDFPAGAGEPMRISRTVKVEYTRTI